MEVSSNEIGMDHVTTYIGVKEPKDEMIKDMKDRFRARLRVAPDVIFKDIDEIQKIVLPEIKRKPMKFVDLRSQD